jgi:hypothetical protein
VESGTERTAAEPERIGVSAIVRQIQAAPLKIDKASISLRRNVEGVRSKPDGGNAFAVRLREFRAKGGRQFHISQLCKVSTVQGLNWRAMVFCWSSGTSRIIVRRHHFGLRQLAAPTTNLRLGIPDKLSPAGSR